MPLSGTYKVFSYDSYEIDLERGLISFSYSVDGGTHQFNPSLEVDLSIVKEKKDIEDAVFNLGMAELPSFYKAFSVSEIEIKAGELTKGQAEFWREVYTKGLGEFFYKNKIDFRNLINLKYKEAKEEKKELSDVKLKKIILPMGGGKDSLVGAEILKERKIDFTWSAIELDNNLVETLASISGVGDVIYVKRDPKENFKKIEELNKKGAYNGHVPVSLVYAFVMVLIAKIHGFSHIAVSNERSASVGNLNYLGEEINHQWSKSFEFEVMCNKYIRKYIDKDIYYFSVVRNLYEIQILEKFSKFPKYFSDFVSCPSSRKINQGDQRWCKKCSKCAFVFAGLSAFLEPMEVESIFEGNMFKDKEMLPTFMELSGKIEQKPFDCVGTTEESLLALYLAKERYDDENMPHVLKELDVSEGKKHMYLLSDNTDNHIIPKEII